MKPGRLSRIFAVCLAIFSMLVMQLAVATYACPGMQVGNLDAADAMTATTGDLPLTACAGMDQANPALCAAHADSETVKLTSGTPQFPDVLPFIPGAVISVVHPVDAVFASINLPPPAATLTVRATAPPLSIRNCCFRI